MVWPLQKAEEGRKKSKNNTWYHTYFIDDSDSE
jgi:hypothetical protein